MQLRVNCKASRQANGDKNDFISSSHRINLTTTGKNAENDESQFSTAEGAKNLRR